MTKLRSNDKSVRIAFVRDLITMGYSNAQIIDAFITKFKTQQRAAYRYINIVLDFLHSEVKEKTVEQILTEYNELIKKYEAFDPRLAKEYRMHRDKIFGYLQQKIDITSGGKELPTTINIIHVNKKDADNDDGIIHGGNSKIKGINI